VPLCRYFFPHGQFKNSLNYQNVQIEDVYFRKLSQNTGNEYKRAELKSAETRVSQVHTECQSTHINQLQPTS
jgi:hypothetical protein